MNITLLGHYDIASLYALDRVIGLLPEHNHSVLLSGVAETKTASDSALAELHKVDAQLCERFLSGSIHGPVAAQVTARSQASFDSPNSTQGRCTLDNVRPDLIISIRYRHILHDAAIAIPRLGVLNLHSGILPDYRGVMATFWAMLNGEEQVGSTLHWIVDSGIDTGPIIDITRRAARPGLSYLANVLGLYADGCDMIARAVRAIDRGKPPPAGQQTAKGHYYAAPGEADIGRFKRRQLHLFGTEDVAEIRAL